MQFNHYQALTFDCYGTLIDWESGVLSALKPILAKHQIQLEDDDLFTATAKHLEVQFDSIIPANVTKTYFPNIL